MTVGARLQLRPAGTVCVLAPPDGVDLELPEGTRRVDGPGQAGAVIAFAVDAAALAAHRAAVVEAAARDALAWLCYPKARQLGTDLTRDVAAELVVAGGRVRPVRQVSIDTVWSALRFRPVPDGGS
ncbi:MAG: hypothetical protein ACQETV_06535 [Actinomycetota bacterium]